MTIRLYTPAELLDFPEPVWLVEPFIVEGGFSVLFGPSNTYKSFVSVDWAARAPGTAVYIAAEGSPRKFGDRVAAWEQAAGRPSGILCIPHAVNLLEPDDVAALIDALDGVDARLLVVDTASRNMAGGDENSTQDMARLVAEIDKLRLRFGFAAHVIHHSGHENTDRERGSSALRGAADFSIRAKKADGLQVRLECAKVRDFEPWEPVVVRLEPIGASLVACEPVTSAEALDRLVSGYMDEHPEASQREVEREVPGNDHAIRAAYKRVRQVRPTLGRTPDAPSQDCGQGLAAPDTALGEASERVRPSAANPGPHPGQGAAKGVRPIEAAPWPQSPLDAMLDPDEYVRALQDGGW